MYRSPYIGSIQVTRDSARPTMKRRDDGAQRPRGRRKREDGEGSENKGTCERCHKHRCTCNRDAEGDEDTFDLHAQNQWRLQAAAAMTAGEEEAIKAAMTDVRKWCKERGLNLASYIQLEALHPTIQEQVMREWTPTNEGINWDNIFQALCDAASDSESTGTNQERAHKNQKEAGCQTHTVAVTSSFILEDWKRNELLALSAAAMLVWKAGHRYTTEYEEEGKTRQIFAVLATLTAANQAHLPQIRECEHYLCTPTTCDLGWGDHQNRHICRTLTDTRCDSCNKWICATCSSKDETYAPTDGNEEDTHVAAEDTPKPKTRAKAGARKQQSGPGQQGSGSGQSTAQKDKPPRRGTAPRRKKADLAQQGEEKKGPKNEEPKRTRAADDPLNPSVEVADISRIDILRGRDHSPGARQHPAGIYMTGEELRHDKERCTFLNSQHIPGIPIEGDKEQEKALASFCLPNGMPGKRYSRKYKECDRLWEERMHAPTPRWRQEETDRMMELTRPGEAREAYC